MLVPIIPRYMNHTVYMRCANGIYTTQHKYNSTHLVWREWWICTKKATKRSWCMHDKNNNHIYVPHTTVDNTSAQSHRYVCIWTGTIARNRQHTTHHCRQWRWLHMKPCWRDLHNLTITANRVCVLQWIWRPARNTVSRTRSILNAQARAHKNSSYKCGYVVCLFSDAMGLSYCKFAGNYIFDIVFSFSTMSDCNQAHCGWFGYTNIQTDDL